MGSSCRRGLMLACAVAWSAVAGAQQELVRFAGASCETPPVLHCPETGCPSDRVINPGLTVEMKTRRTYFLDYPCDLAPGEKVTFVLSLHGGGSYGNWQRHYFPLVDYKDKYRLVIATPNSPTRVWTEADDEYLRNIVESVVAQLGPESIRSFWLAGHSQGGATSRRLVCTDFFADKVDGFLSLSGGRVGGNPGRADFGFTPGASPAGGTPPGGAAALTSMARLLAELPACDFSHVYATGEHELDDRGLPESSEWAAKYSCGQRAKPREVADTRAGYVYDSARQNPPNPAWGLLPGPGVAQISEYPNCAEGRVVADAVRLGKGHTEGLEPAITEEIVKVMVEAPGGKLSRQRTD
jgi:pimeloyl-ACP methyl ester carboxylesterase